MIFWEDGRKFEIVVSPAEDDEDAEWYEGMSLELIEHTDKGEDYLFTAYRSDSDHKVLIEIQGYDIVFPVMQRFMQEIQRQLVDSLPIKANTPVSLGKILEEVYALPTEFSLFLGEKPWHLHTLGALLDTRGMLLPDETPFAKARALRYAMSVKQLQRVASRLYEENEDATPEQFLERLIVAKAMEGH